MKKTLAALLSLYLLLIMAGCADDQQAIYDEFADKPSSASSSRFESDSSSSNGPDSELQGELRVGVKLPVESNNNVNVGIGLVAKEFEAMHPHVKITVEPGITVEEMMDTEMYPATESRYTQKRIVELMSGEAPDIMEMSGISISRYAGSGLLCDLYSFGDFDQAFPADEFYTGMLKGAETEKGLFAIPISGYPSVMWVNQEVAGLLDIDLQAMESVTIRDLLDMYRSAVEQGIVEDSFVLDSDMTAVSLIANEYPALLDRAEGKALFDSDEFCELLEKTKSADFANPVAVGYQGSSVTGTADTFDTTTRLVNSGSFGRQNLLLYKIGSLKAEPIPIVTASGQRMFSGNTFAITENSKNKELAWEFLKFAISFQNMDEQGNAICTAGLYQEGKPVTKNEYYDDRYNRRFSLKRAFLQDALQAALAKSYDEDFYGRIAKMFDKSDTLAESDPLFYDALIPIYTDYFDHDLLTAQQCAKQLQEKADIYLQE